jgi:hypothetical protein
MGGHTALGLIQLHIVHAAGNATRSKRSLHALDCLIGPFLRDAAWRRRCGKFLAPRLALICRLYSDFETFFVALFNTAHKVIANLV